MKVAILLSVHIQNNFQSGRCRRIEGYQVQTVNLFDHYDLSIVQGYKFYNKVTMYMKPSKVFKDHEISNQQKGYWHNTMMYVAQAND